MLPNTQVYASAAALRAFSRLEARPFRAHLGVLVHAVIGECLFTAGPNGDPLSFRSAVVASRLAADPFRHDRRRGFLLLSGMVRTYFTLYRRPAPWVLLGIEVWTDTGGRIDLLFLNTVSRQVAADELKATSDSRSLPADELKQLERYVIDLTARFGRRFSGVRVVHLAPPTSELTLCSVADVRAAAAGPTR